MKRNKKRIIAAVAVISALAAGGAAFTAANVIPPSTVGYGTSQITGATATDVTYKMNAKGTVITGATLVFQKDLWDRTVSTPIPYTVKAGFGTDNLTSCTVAAYDSGTSTDTVYCGDADLTAASPAFTQATDGTGSDTFNVAIAGGKTN